MLGKILHVGLVVDDMERAVKMFEDLLEVQVNRKQMVDAGFGHATFLRVGDVEIEIMKPTDPANHYTKLLREKGPCLSHICFGVPDTEAAVRRLREKGIRFLPGFDSVGVTPRGLKIVFLDPAQTEGIIVQIAQDDRPFEDRTAFYKVQPGAGGGC